MTTLEEPADISAANPVSTPIGNPGPPDAQPVPQAVTAAVDELLTQDGHSEHDHETPKLVAASSATSGAIGSQRTRRRWVPLARAAAVIALAVGVAIPLTRSDPAEVVAASDAGSPAQTKGAETPAPAAASEPAPPAAAATPAPPPAAPAPAPQAVAAVAASDEIPDLPVIDFLPPGLDEAEVLFEPVEPFHVELPVAQPSIPVTLSGNTADGAVELPTISVPHADYWIFDITGAGFDVVPDEVVLLDNPQACSLRRADLPLFEVPCDRASPQPYSPTADGFTTTQGFFIDVEGATIAASDADGTAWGSVQIVVDDPSFVPPTLSGPQGDLPWFATYAGATLDISVAGFPAETDVRVTACTLPIRFDPPDIFMPRPEFFNGDETCPAFSTLTLTTNSDGEFSARAGLVPPPDTPLQDALVLVADDGDSRSMISIMIVDPILTGGGSESEGFELPEKIFGLAFPPDEQYELAVCTYANPSASDFETLQTTRQEVFPGCADDAEMLQRTPVWTNQDGAFTEALASGTAAAAVAYYAIDAQGKVVGFGVDADWAALRSTEGAASELPTDAPAATITVTPSVVPSPGEYELTVTGSEWLTTELFVLACEPEFHELAAEAPPAGDLCDLSLLSPASPDADGNWTVTISFDVPAEGIAIAAGDPTGVQVASALVTVSE